MTETDIRPRRSRWTIALWLGVPAVLLVLAGLSAIALVRRERRIETARAEQIRVGMTQAELWEQLGGAPDFEQRWFGLVEGPEKFTTNHAQSRPELAKRGFRDYRFQQWTTPRVNVVVVSDPNGGVACRYSSGGHDIGLFRRLWFVVSGKARRPPEDGSAEPSGVPASSP